MLLEDLNFLPDTARNKANLKIISSSLKSGAISHAYLFTGNNIDVLSRISLIFSAAVNCLQGGCGTCLTCKNTLKGLHENLVLVEADGNILTLDKIEQLQKAMSVTSYSQGFKICIIKEADLMNREAANRLLKTLEDPPGEKNIFLLLTEDLPSMLPTIISRCIILEWELADAPQSKVKIDINSLKLMMDQKMNRLIECGGSYDLALDLSTSIIDSLRDNLEEEDAVLKEQVSHFKESGATSSEIKKFEESLRLKNRRKINKYFNLGINIVFDIITDWLEDVITVRQGCAREILNNPENFDFIGKNIGFFPYQKIIELLADIEKNRKYLKYSIYPELALDNIFLKLQAFKMN